MSIKQQNPIDKDSQILRIEKINNTADIMKVKANNRPFTFVI
ncbi:MAG TPA: hypothetical protein VK590_06655 [Saprospiraceae bacterium]|nr:hypothetical protein [Saprospiraceae bacterium]